MNERESDAERILVIKHGALGDFVLATGPFKAIRAHHLDSRITLLTSPPFEALGRDCGYFEDIWLDGRPGLFQVVAWLQMRKRFLAGQFDRVYDLQTSDRTGWYYRMWPSPKPQWSGIAKGCSHPHDNPDRDYLHTVDRQAEQLRLAGIDFVPKPDVDWLDAPVAGFQLPVRTAILVPGGSPLRPQKRWPATHYAALARRLFADGLVPVLVGTEAERDVTSEIAQHCEGAVDLTGRTSLSELASLCRRAEICIGNDTGPMHISALTGCRTVVLFSRDSDPALCAPRGPQVAVIRRDRLEDLAVEDVFREAQHSA